MDVVFRIEKLCGTKRRDEFYILKTCKRESEASEKSGGPVSSTETKHSETPWWKEKNEKSTTWYNVAKLVSAFTICRSDLSLKYVMSVVQPLVSGFEQHAFFGSLSQQHCCTVKPVVAVANTTKSNQI